MKYRFITIMHNMKLDTIKNRGIRVSDSIMLSNGRNIMESTMSTMTMKTTIGIHSIDEFENTVYAYSDGEMKEIDSIDKMNKKGTDLTFMFLRDIQSLLIHLWQVKDNNIYIRDGFLLFYKDDFEDGYTFKGSLSAIFSCSNLIEEHSIFTDEEVKLAVEREKVFDSDNPIKSDIDWDYKKASNHHFYKKNNSLRIHRALYFIISARGSSTLPMKIVFYCTALECLFTISKVELNHKIAERVAHLLGTSKEEKMKLFKLVKKSYDTRSVVVHGGPIKDERDELLNISSELDEVMRRLFNSDLSIYMLKDHELEKYFTELLF